MAATGVSRRGSVAETDIVPPTGTISSIFSAVGLANDEDTISIDHGACEEQIIVDESIKLMSTHRLSIDG